MQNRDTYTTSQTRCSTVNDSKDQVVGYDVKYLLDGKIGQVRMDHEPGKQLEVKNGQVLASQ